MSRIKKHPKIKSEFKISENFFIIIVLLLCIFGFTIRLYNLGYLTLWVDEYVHANRALCFPKCQLFTTDNNGILLTFFIIPLYKLFQANEFWSRMPSVIFGTLSIPLIYQFGRKYFNKTIGIIASLLLTFSLYHIFWSRIARNYAIFLFFFLLFLFFIAKVLNAKNNFIKTNNYILNYFKVDFKTLSIVLGLFVLTLLSHQLSLLFLYGFCCYHTMIFIIRVFKKRKINFFSLNAIVTYLSVILVIIMFVPFFQTIVKLILNLFLPERIQNWILPDIAYLKDMLKENPYSTFNKYFNVLKNDITNLYILGFVGFIFGVIRFKKSGIFLISFFCSIFLLMSFVFRDPSTPRYIIFIYPLFLISIAITLDTGIVFISKFLEKYNFYDNKVFRYIIFILIGITLVFFTPIKKDITMVKTKKHGRVIDEKLSVWDFPNLREPLNAIKTFIKDDDILVATLPYQVNFYLRKEALQFRQRQYNSNKRRYELLKPDLTNDNAYSYQAFKKLYEKYERGWLIADYYFYNSLTDPRARDFVIKNVNFLYNYSNSYVKIFHWDKSNSNKQRNRFVELLDDENILSKRYRIIYNKITSKKCKLVLDIEGIKYDNELTVRVNGRDIPIQRRYSNFYVKYKNSTQRQIYSIILTSKYLKEGINEIGFFCKTNNQKIIKSKIGIYNIGFLPVQVSN